MSATIRAATPADLDAIVALWDSAAGPTRLKSDVDAARALLHRDPKALLVATEGGRIVGTIIVGWDGWRCHLYRMAVASDARRRGVGAALVAAATEYARSVGARRMDALVADSNELGIAFWTGQGFEVDALDSRWVKPL